MSTKCKKFKSQASKYENVYLRKLGKRGSGIDFGLGRGYSGSQVMWRLWKWMNDARARNQMLSHSGKNDREKYRGYLLGSPMQLQTSSLQKVTPMSELCILKSNFIFRLPDRCLA